MLGSNPEAAADSYVMTEAFLAARLKGRKSIRKDAVAIGASESD
jgi:hypothetical protein